MKHRFENGKWMPENGTFVHVPNEQIPEVIQLLRDNGYRSVNNYPDEKTGVVFWHSHSWYNNGGEYSEDYNIKIPFPDFKALVTGKFPESWCIQCTEESIKHEAWPRFIKSINGSCSLSGDGLGWYYYARPDIMVGTIGAASSWKPNCEVLQIETWAALNPVEILEANPHECPECNWQCSCVDQPCSCCDLFKHCTDQHLINELKSRGYTVSKIY